MGAHSGDLRGTPWYLAQLTTPCVVTSVRHRLLPSGKKMKHSKLSEMCEEAITDPAKVWWLWFVQRATVNAESIRTHLVVLIALWSKGQQPLARSSIT